MAVMFMLRKKVSLVMRFVYIMDVMLIKLQSKNQ